MFILQSMVAIHIHIHATTIEAHLSNITSAIYHVGSILVAKFDDLVAEVHAQTTVVDSVLALIDDLEANRDDPTKLQAAIDELVANKTRMANAVAANTAATNSGATESITEPGPTA